MLGAFGQNIHTEGDPEVGHVFYKKPGKKGAERPGYKKNVARALAWENDRKLDQQFLDAVQKEERI